ncbi:hypothetical protein HDU98_006935, partial [Podochytrium sp. JEL0797]
MDLASVARAAKAKQDSENVAPPRVTSLEAGSVPVDATKLSPFKNAALSVSGDAKLKHVAALAVLASRAQQQQQQQLPQESDASAKRENSGARSLHRLQQATTTIIASNALRLATPPPTAPAAAKALLRVTGLAVKEDKIPAALHAPLLALAAQADALAALLVQAKESIDPIIPWAQIVNSLYITAGVFCAWFVGYWNLGIGWVFVVMFFVNGAYRRNMQRIKSKISTETSRLLGLKRLESDSETLEWFNLFLSKFWIEYEPSLSTSLKNTIDPILHSSKPAFLDDLALTVFSLGSVAPRIETIKTIVQGSDADSLIMEWDLKFVPVDESGISAREKELGNVRHSYIEVVAKLGKGPVAIPIPVVVSEIEFRGTLRLELKFVTKFPHISTVDYMFTHTPGIDFTLRPLKALDMMDLPGLKSSLDNILGFALAGFVAPHRNTIDVDSIVNGTGAEVPLGVLKITIHEAKGLHNFELAGISDPYVSIRIGGQVVARTKTIGNALNPYWGQTLLVPVLRSSLFFTGEGSVADLLEMEVFDENEASSDRSMGLVAPLRLSRWVKLLEEDLSPEGKVVEVVEEDVEEVKTAADGKADDKLPPAVDKDGKPIPVPEKVEEEPKPPLSCGDDLTADERESLITEWGPPTGDAGSDVWHGVYPRDAIVTREIRKRLGEIRLEMSYLPVTTMDGLKAILEAKKPTGAAAATQPNPGAPATPAAVARPASTIHSSPVSTAADMKHIPPSRTSTSASLSMSPTATPSTIAPPTSPLSSPTMPLPETHAPDTSNSGVLTATIHAGKELPGSRVSTLKCEVVLSKVEFAPTGNWAVGSTPAVKKTNNPTWDCPVRFYVADSETACLRFMVKDGSRVVGEVSMKVCDAIKRLTTKDAVVDWFRLTGTDHAKIRITFAWHPIDPTYLQVSPSSPRREPKGVIKFKLLKAKQLVNVEIMGRKSDPYAKIHIGHAPLGASLVKDNTLDPVWNETFYGVVYSKTQRIFVEVWDFNNIKKDKSLGSVELKFDDLMRFHEPVETHSPVLQKLIQDGLEVSFNGHALTVVAPIYLQRIELEDDKDKKKDGAAATDADDATDPNATPTISTPKSTKNPLTDAPATSATDFKSALLQRGFLYFEMEYYDVLGPNEHVHALEEEEYEFISRTRADVVKEVSRLRKLAEVGVLTKEEAEARVAVVVEKGFVGELDATRAELLRLPVARDVVEKHDSGILRFHLYNAKGINKPCNPYIDIRLNNYSYYTTRVQKNDKSPVWNATADVCARSISGQTLTILLLDSRDGETKSTDDTLLGIWNGELMDILGHKMKLVTLQGITDAIKLKMNLEYLPINRSASNLEAVDSSGTSDPYCVIDLNGEQIHKTLTHKKQLNPIFNESVNVFIHSRLRSTINFTLRDWNPIGKHTVLGTSELDLMNITCGELCKVSLPLSGARCGQLNMSVLFDPHAASNKSNESSTMDQSDARMEKGEDNAALKMTKGVGMGAIDVFKGIGKKVLGDVKQDQRKVITAAAAAQAIGAKEKDLTGPVEVPEILVDMFGAGISVAMAAPRPPAISGTVLLTIESARNLKAVDENGEADPYVKVNQLLHGKVKTLHKTKVQKKNRNPVWGESVHFKSPPSIITLVIKDYNMFGGSKPLGEVELDLDKLFAKGELFDEWVPVGLGGAGEI